MANSVPHVVLLVDARRRDLMASALIAHHLKKQGIAAFLEPINAWRAVLGAHRPDLIVFNHVSAKHLAEYSGQLHKRGVLTAVLPNEGILYNPDELEYNSKSYFPGTHVDHYFCWNEVHRDALIRNRFAATSEGVKAVGVPRFDLYRDPWKRLYQKPRVAGARPIILMCGNFPLAHYHELPPEFADQFFSQWLETVPMARDYKNAIRANHSARAVFHRYVEALLATDKYDIIVRPHPREGREFYQKWLDTLSPAHRSHVRLAMEESIADLILNCDLQVSCEHCTTALESWIVGQPTIELVFEKHHFWYNQAERAGLNIECMSPEELPGLVAEGLRQPAPAALREKQQAHLRKWCGPVDGTSAKQVADVIVEALKKRGAREPLKLTFADYRRGLKHRIYHAIGQPYTFFPMHQFLRWVFRRKNYSRRMTLYQKSIRPAEVQEALALLEKCG